MCLNIREQLSDCLGFSQRESSHCSTDLSCVQTSQFIPNSGSVRTNTHEQRFQSQSPVDGPHAGPLPPHFLNCPSKFVCIQCADGVRAGEAHLLPRGPGSLPQIPSGNQMACALGTDRSRRGIPFQVQVHRI